MTDSGKSWEKFLHPETLRGNLIAISLFITAFEIFKARVIEKPETMYSSGFNECGPIIAPAYKIDVLARSKSKLYASLLWLKEQGAIEQKDIATFDAIRMHRNEVAHEPLAFIADHKKNLDTAKFMELVQLLKKVETWWFKWFEVAVNPEILPEGADPDEAMAGVVFSLQLMLDIALGNEPEEGYFYKHFTELRR
jgi:hypothetical protein